MFLTLESINITCHKDALKVTFGVLISVTIVLTIISIGYMFFISNVDYPYIFRMILLSRLKYDHRGSNTSTVERIATDVRATTIKDVMFTIKSSAQFHETRLKLLFQTWVAMVSNQTYVITDSDDEEYTKYLPDGHFVTGHCAPGHGRPSLCCKMALELGAMVSQKHKYRWFCRADDDTYYNQHGLVPTLKRFDWHESHIIGRASPHDNAFRDGKPFWYPMGNAGVCLSRALIDRLHPHIIGDNFEKFCSNWTLTDDVCLGAIAYIHGRTLIDSVETMYTHGSTRVTVLSRPLRDMVTINYRQRRGKVVRAAIEPLSPAFNKTRDPTRLLSLHCHLNPTLTYCAELFPLNHTRTVSSVYTRRVTRHL